MVGTLVRAEPTTPTAADPVPESDAPPPGPPGPPRLIGVLEVLSHGAVDGMVVSEAFLAATNAS